MYREWRCWIIPKAVVHAINKYHNMRVKNGDTSIFQSKLFHVLFQCRAVKSVFERFDMQEFHIMIALHTHPPTAITFTTSLPGPLEHRTWTIYYEINDTDITGDGSYGRRFRLWRCVVSPCSRRVSPSAIGMPFACLHFWLPILI